MPAPAKKPAALPEANVDMSGLVAEEIQNEVDGVDDLPDNSNEALEAEAKAAIAAQPTMHQGTSTL